jgi:hypothetical protein
VKFDESVTASFIQARYTDFFFFAETYNRNTWQEANGGKEWN